MDDIKPCPFCGGKAKVSHRQFGFRGYYMDGNKEVRYRVQVICNRCHARGKPVTTEWMRHSLMQYYPKNFEKYNTEATESWNRAERRADNEYGQANNSVRD